MNGAKLIINWRHDLEQILMFFAPILTYIKIKLNKLNEYNVIYMNFATAPKKPSRPPSYYKGFQSMDLHRFM